MTEEGAHSPRRSFTRGAISRYGIATTLAATTLMFAPPATAATCAPGSSSDGLSTVLTFPTSANCDWTVPANVTSVEYLIVGGGGGGGYNRGGGGGGGGVLAGTATVTPGAVLQVVVGEGGAGSSNTNFAGTNGGDSSFSAIGTAALGGGGGGTHFGTGAATESATAGGSGGGASINYGTTVPTGGAGTAGQGNAGGNASSGDDPRNTGGGGGAGSSGTSGSGITTRPNGGDGVTSSIAGAIVTYGGGGGGASGSEFLIRTTAGAGLGGSGGGGAGGAGATGPAAGTNGLGGGGGGAPEGDTNFPGARGGDGTVILRYLTPTSDADLSALSASAGPLAPIFSSAVLRYTLPIDEDTTATTITSTAGHPGATITIDGVPVTSGSPSLPITIAPGTFITIVVTSLDTTTTQSYRIEVTLKQDELAPPSWLWAYSRQSHDSPCREGWNASWALWPNDNTGGFTCERRIEWNTLTRTWDERAGW